MYSVIICYKSFTFSYIYWCTQSHHQLTEQPKLPCTHSATTTTNLTAVFKSWGRIDIFLSSDGFKTAFSPCDIFWNTLCSLSVKFWLVPLDFFRLLMNSSVYKQRAGIAVILINYITLYNILLLLHFITTLRVVNIIMYDIGLLYLLPDCPASSRFTFRGINRAPLSRHASQASPVGEAIQSCAPFSWTASRLGGACSNSQPLDTPHTVFLSWTPASCVMRHINWWRKKCK